MERDDFKQKWNKILLYSHKLGRLTTYPFSLWIMNFEIFTEQIFHCNLLLLRLAIIFHCKKKKKKQGEDEKLSIIINVQITFQFDNQGRLSFFIFICPTCLGRCICDVWHIQGLEIIFCGIIFPETPSQWEDVVQESNISKTQTVFLYQTNELS